MIQTMSNLKVEESVLKTKTLEEVHEELRTKLVSSIKMGCDSQVSSKVE